MRKWLPLLTVCLGTFMLLVDVTIVNVALPKMATDLKTSFGALQWVVDAYALTLAALVLGTGSIADRFGHRRAYVAGLAVFAVSSLVCGLSPNVSVLIAARTVQGLGAAAMFATTIALLNSSYSGRDRGIAYGMWGAVAGASSAIGPILGGVLTEGISWRWIFFVNLPVSVLAIALCTVLADVQTPTRTRIDILGMVVFAAASGSATYGFIRASEHGWSSVGTWVLLLAAVVLLVAFLAIEARSSHPMLDLALLRNRSFVGVLIAALVLTFAAFSALTYVSIWLQSVLDLSLIQAGLTGLPLSVAAFAVAASIGRFLHGARPGPIIGGGLILIGLGGLLLLLFVRGDAGWATLVPGYVLIGIGVGLATPTLNSAGLSAVPPQRGGMAAGALNTARQLGFAFGIALLGTVFASRAASALAERGVPDATRTARALAGGQAARVLRAVPDAARASLDHTLHVASITGLQSTFLIGGLGGVVAGVLALVLIRPAGGSADAHPTRVAGPPEPTPTLGSTSS